MRTMITLSTLSAVLFLGAVTTAGSWERNGSVTGPRGTAQITGSGSCAGGTCGRSLSRTGPAGHSVSRQDSATCTGGACEGSRTVTGPAGQSVMRQGSASCADGACSGTRTLTGRAGQTVTRQGSLSR